MQTVTLPLETLNKVLQALASMPYSQVHELIAEVQSKVEIDDRSEEESKVPRAVSK